MDKKEKKSLPEPRTYTVEQIAAIRNHAKVLSGDLHYDHKDRER